MCDKLIDKSSYLNHINDSEKVVKMKQILDKIEIVMKNHNIEYTDFLDPYEIRLAKSILNRFIDLEYKIYGGYNDSERSIIIIYPEYLAYEDIDLGLDILKIEGYIEGLRHPDYLGAILNLGIVRDKVGDILVYEDYSLVIVKKEVSSFILYNLEKISNRNVNISYVEEIHELPEKIFSETKEFLTSLRLDVVISAAYNISRKNSSELVKQGKVKVNWEQIDKPAYEVEVGDIISARGFGRASISTIEGLSKKGRFAVKMIKLI